jgi:hypothetical protein
VSVCALHNIRGTFRFELTQSRFFVSTYRETSIVLKYDAEHFTYSELELGSIILIQYGGARSICE